MRQLCSGTKATMVGLALISVSVAAGGCASAGGGGGGTSGTSSMITRAQIEESGAKNAFDLIQQYRPRWLRPSRNQNTLSGQATARARGQDDGDVLWGQETYPRIYLDGAYFGDLDALTDMPTDGLASVEFIDAREATTRYGTGNMAGIIQMHSLGLQDR